MLKISSTDLVLARGQDSLKLNLYALYNLGGSRTPFSRVPMVTIPKLPIVMISQILEKIQKCDEMAK
jgi:hypothetical protein